MPGLGPSTGIGCRVVVVATVLLAATTAPGATAASRTIRVPQVIGNLGGLPGAYEQLRQAGLRVTLTPPRTMSQLCTVIAERQSPGAGTRVPSGSTVTLSGLRCYLGSVVAPLQPPPPTVVPDLVGWSASRSMRWIQSAGLSWSIKHPPALRRATRPHLFDNYVVTTVLPAPGTTISDGAPAPAVVELGVRLR